MSLGLGRRLLCYGWAVTLVVHCGWRTFLFHFHQAKATWDVSSVAPSSHRFPSTSAPSGVWTKTQSLMTNRHWVADSQLRRAVYDCFLVLLCTRSTFTDSFQCSHVKSNSIESRPDQRFFQWFGDWFGLRLFATAFWRARRRNLDFTEF